MTDKHFLHCFPAVCKCYAVFWSFFSSYFIFYFTCCEDTWLFFYVSSERNSKTDKQMMLLSFHTVSECFRGQSFFLYYSLLFHFAILFAFYIICSLWRCMITFICERKSPRYIDTCFLFFFPAVCECFWRYSLTIFLSFLFLLLWRCIIIF